MPFQKGNKWGSKSKRTSSLDSKKPKEETKVEEPTPTAPVEEALTLYREPSGWCVDYIKFQDGKIIHREHVCPSTLKGEAVDAYKIKFAEKFILES